MTVNRIMRSFLNSIARQASGFLLMKIYIGKNMAGVPEKSIVLFPCHATLLPCGLAGIIAFKKGKEGPDLPDFSRITGMVQKIKGSTFERFENMPDALNETYLGGESLIDSFWKISRELKTDRSFAEIFFQKEIQENLSAISHDINGILQSETNFFSKKIGYLDTAEAESISIRIEKLKDIAWCLDVEVLENIKKVRKLLEKFNEEISPETVMIFRKINAVLNSIDRLEVRGRDSAGISLMFIISEDEYLKFNRAVDDGKLGELIDNRVNQDALVNLGISIHELANEKGKKQIAMTLAYKIAAEIGKLGDNVRFLRTQIKEDSILKIVAGLSHLNHTVTAHTRWASVGAITGPNCHPVDNKTLDNGLEKKGIIHVCLNGDIDNHRELKQAYEDEGGRFNEEITTDTKIIPIQIERYLKSGNSIEEAFRLAVNDFQGSHAISMHTNLAPGKIFLAQRGSGQAVFVGIATEHYMPTSEVYGFVEETSDFIKMDGEKIVEGTNGRTQGQIFILDQSSAGGLEGIHAAYYDGTPIELKAEDIKHTEITSRDIDRQGFPHYFLKEISEAPESVRKTLQNRWKIKDEQKYVIRLDEKAVPGTVRDALANNRIRRVFFVGQGTAGVAAQVCANILEYYMNDPLLYITALKASELSGFKLGEFDGNRSLEDTLIIAISQSGTTTDTNRAVDMVKERGGLTLAIVNRRDSDITFKVDGVIYTSSGRDIEMSVASTKAFYSQIVAGAVMGLFFAGLKGNRSQQFITDEIKQLLELPEKMRAVLSMKEAIGESAKRLATTRTYWAAVGSGPNKASADEIRIKLSELCYKTISSDFVEDKKHIDLSSEPLIIVCAAGTRANVIGDIIKDTAIFQAHKALPVVIADEGENRFDSYAADVFHVPVVDEHLAPILNTLAGHIWGYYAALSINEGSSFLHLAREEIRESINEYAERGMDVYEVLLEKGFKEKVADFYNRFRKKRSENRLPSIMENDSASDLTLLLKYLTGRLPVSDFELDFGKKGTALNMLNALFECLGEAINCMARPVDAIKHQAKTVTVGTSRISEKVEGILFDALETYNIKVSQLINRNVIVLKNLQGVVSKIKGAILYQIDNLSLLGEPTEETSIRVLRKDGVLKPIPSRVETDTLLKGTKRIIAQQGNVYIGKGRKDDRSIIVIPIISDFQSAPNRIENLLLLNIGFKDNVELPVKKKALGGKYEHIKNIVQENSIEWDDRLLEKLDMKELFGSSAEKIGEFIVHDQKLKSGI
ncbi:MAG: SIS domain-containing protein [Desulfobacterales bacterium]